MTKSHQQRSSDFLLGRFLLAAIALAALGGPALANSPKVGELHPIFHLPEAALSGGRSHSLHDGVGRKTLFVQFASW